MTIGSRSSRRSSPNAAAAAALGAERPPTVFAVKGGEVRASKVGLMNPREMAAFFEKA